MPHSLPPLNALRVFEVAARAGSFTEAAKELHLTHGAVSRQIQLLEDYLGQPLFRKEGQRRVATVHARALASEISAAFDQISDASQRYGKQARHQVLRVSSHATFAMRWLIPRLPAFQQRMPEVEVRVATAFSDLPWLKGRYDVAIRRDPGPEAQFERYPLFRERLSVVASPALLARQPLRSPAELIQVPLLDTDTRPGEWEAWLVAAGCSTLRPAVSLRFDHFFITRQAAVDGLGMAIGGFPILAQDVQQGVLVQPFPDCSIPGSDYVALVPQDADKSRALREFLLWLEEEAGNAKT